ncbi:MAG TPA: biotin carboxylase N-terminal domain-containing protein [Steroidobacteraceae bacterium]|nr:biotin carboxylase N-terminal domain-containing protein [Steroidobacteraceae bacterium]
MFARLLIANRGEIACRVIRTARRLGIRTISVYSDADADARHVRLADEARRIGPALARDSYLSSERILAAAVAAGADAIHPGYGFLSENSGFAAACAARGIAFVGPPAAAIAAMGSKIAAKESMRRAGVPVLPGYQGEDQSVGRLRREALALGFPLIIKPSGGGGGKGMQIVARAEDLDAALDGARRLAGSAFGDASLLIERYLPAPRHVEVQILCDAHGHALHLGTRDCSVQRRHQKLIEEAPAPNIAPAVRARLHAAALTVARAVGYVNAGTVEFLYDDGEFWFMEMNTRLQVEHGVTERIHGIDLVEWQLRIAAGEAVPFAQDELVARGAAIEARICAEDPYHDFAPSAGRLGWVSWPAESAGLRVDAGFESGDEVSSHYDSLLGKLIAHGEDRPGAIAALILGLESFRIVGVASEAGWLAAALASPEFARGAPTTRFVAEHAALSAAAPLPDAHDLALAAAAVAEGLGDPAPADPSPWSARDAFRVNLPRAQTLRLRAGGREFSIELVRERGEWRICGEFGARTLCLLPTSDGHALDGRIDGVRRRIDWWRDGARITLWHGAERIEIEISDPRQGAARASAHEGELVARLPGTVVATPVAVGEAVAAGATLLVVEAMKMEHAIRAPYAGIVRAVHFAVGARVTEGARLIDLEETPTGAGGTA